MKQTHVLLLVSALGFGSTANAGEVADKVRTNDGAECSQIYDTGRKATTGVRLDTATMEPEIYFEFQFDIGRKKLEDGRIDCRPFAKLEKDRMILDNEKLRIEVELLRNQLKRTAVEEEKDEFFKDW